LAIQGRLNAIILPQNAHSSSNTHVLTHKVSLHPLIFENNDNWAFSPLTAENQTLVGTRIRTFE
jgi:hypothetical protein